MQYRINTTNTTTKKVEIMVLSFNLNPYLAPIVAMKNTQIGKVKIIHKSCQLPLNKSA